MPPWFIEKNSGFRSSRTTRRSVTDEIATIATWVDSGAPRGNPADMPPPRRYADAAGWTIGTPDLIVSSPVMTVKATRARLAWRGRTHPDRVDRGPLRSGGRVQGGAGRRGQPTSGWADRQAISTISAFITRGCTKSTQRTASCGRPAMDSAAASISCTSWATTPRFIPPRRACC